MHQNKPICLLICALGGEGGGVLTEWLIDIAHACGYAAQSTSIPGVAQRTGATTYYLEVFPVPLERLGGKRPVFSLNPVPGTLDALVSSELLETVRQIGAGFAAPERTLVISSTSRTLTTQERMVPGDGRTDSAPLVEIVRRQSREHHLFDMGEMARQSGTVVSAVMLGAIAGSGVFPFAREAFEAVIKEGGNPAMAAASLRGFALAYQQVNAQRAQAAMVAGLLGSDEAQAPPARALPLALVQDFPAAVHDMLALGAARMLEYQGQAYADLYVRRLRQVLAAERESDPAAAQSYAITREMARWLALWMAFDDIVRVSDLKSRASRWQRVKGEVKPGEQDLLRVYDYFKPGAVEFAALLPDKLAGMVTRWDRRRVARGKEPWAMPIMVGTHSVFGMLALRTLASLKFLRLRGSRYAVEQALIEKWLDGVLAGTRSHWQLGHEIALCGRLIKGYGATNERGKERLLHVLDHLAVAAPFAGPQARAQAIAAAREAALADDSGTAFDKALVQYGAPARELRPQPIRWVKRAPKAGSSTGSAGL